ncbi:MAG: hypothetical protein R3233_00280 [Xanthomonadales bacterium]|nr:hypothetical protein [Xanthomonadales bacterium]
MLQHLFRYIVATLLTGIASFALPLGYSISKGMAGVHRQTVLR